MICNSNSEEHSSFIVEAGDIDPRVWLAYGNLKVSDWFAACPLRADVTIGLTAFGPAYGI